MPAVNPETLSSLMDGTQVPSNSWESFQQPYFDKYGPNAYGAIIGGNDSTPWRDKRWEFGNRWQKIIFQPGNPYYSGGTPEEVAAFELNKAKQLNGLRNDMNTFFKMDGTTGYQSDATRLQSDVERYGSTGMTNKQLSPLIDQVNTWSPNNTWNNFYGRPIPTSEIPGILGSKKNYQSATSPLTTGAGLSNPTEYNTFAATSPTYNTSYTRPTQSSTNRKRRWYESWTF